MGYLIARCPGRNSDRNARRGVGVVQNKDAVGSQIDLHFAGRRFAWLRVLQNAEPAAQI